MGILAGNFVPLLAQTEHSANGEISEEKENPCRPRYCRGGSRRPGTGRASERDRMRLRQRGGGGGYCDSDYTPDGSYTHCETVYVMGFGGTNCYRVFPPK